MLQSSHFVSISSQQLDCHHYRFFGALVFSLVFGLLLFVVVPTHCPGCPGTGDPLPLTSSVLGLEVWTTGHNSFGAAFCQHRAVITTICMVANPQLPPPSLCANFSHCSSLCWKESWNNMRMILPHYNFLNLENLEKDLMSSFCFLSFRCIWVHVCEWVCRFTFEYRYTCMCVYLHGKARSQPWVSVFTNCPNCFVFLS